MSLARAVLLALLLALAACAAPPPAAPATPDPTAPATPAPARAPDPTPLALGATPTPAPAPLRVLADPALGPALAELTGALAALVPGAAVDLRLAPSDQISADLLAGAEADVVVLAGEASLAALVEAGLVAGDLALPIAADRLVVVTPPQAGAAGVEALAAPGARVAVVEPARPEGDAAREALATLGLADARLVPFPDEAAVTAAVIAGAADAGLVFGSAVTPLVELELRPAELPRDAQMRRLIVMAPINGGQQAELAGELAALAASGTGQATLGAYNLLSPPIAPLAP